MSIKIASNTSAFKHCCPSAVIEAHCCGCTEAENPPLVSFFKYYTYSIISFHSTKHVAVLIYNDTFQAVQV